MLSVSDLESLGFSRSHAQLLVRNNKFVLIVKNQSKDQFGVRLNNIAKIYGVSRKQAAKVIFSFPPFAGLDHNRVVRDIVRAYLDMSHCG